MKKSTKWWCRISLRVSATDTDAAFDDLEKYMPALGQAVAEKLGLRADDVRVDSWMIIPYLEKDQ